MKRLLQITVKGPAENGTDETFVKSTVKGPAENGTDETFVTNYRQGQRTERMKRLLQITPRAG